MFERLELSSTPAPLRRETFPRPKAVHSGLRALRRVKCALVALNIVLQPRNQEAKRGKKPYCFVGLGLFVKALGWYERI